MRAALGWMLAAAGCGYTVGPLVPPGVRTVAIAPAENLTDRRDLDWNLTRAIGEELQARGLVVALGGGADSTLHVRVRQVKERVVAESPRDEVLAGEVTVEADVVLRRRNGSVAVERRGIREAAGYVASLGQTEDTAIEAATRVLARRIADALVGGF
ncbi:MAG: LPS assembly lipoprotein LptE [Planctomycetales bacterium]|nr:LPS assembly lipoprotein LptE [Planctomycetales bacterium]